MCVFSHYFLPIFYNAIFTFHFNKPANLIHEYSIPSEGFLCWLRGERHHKICHGCVESYTETETTKDELRSLSLSLCREVDSLGLGLQEPWDENCHLSLILKLLERDSLWQDLRFNYIYV